MHEERDQFSEARVASDYGRHDDPAACYYHDDTATRDHNDDSDGSLL
jgi:hypothetical protein